ncbi:MAG: DNA polymerase III subunit alpha [Acetobacteraceae bacterium]
MARADFVHLRVHSAYSLSEGAIKAPAIAALAAEQGMPAVALTDSGNLFGALEFSEAASERGVQPIVGCEIGLARAGNPRLPPDPLVLLAMDEAGLANLQRLSSLAFLETDAGLGPRLGEARIAEHAAGLFLLTGGTVGPLGRLVAEGQEAEARALLAALKEAFPERIAVELNRQGLAGERNVEAGLIRLAEHAGLALVATNDCRFADPEMFEAADALLCIAEGRLLAETDRRRACPEQWFKPASVMRELFADLKDACDNTLAIAGRCAVMAETRKPMLPRFAKLEPGVSEEERLTAMARAGLAQRLVGAGGERSKRYEERLEYELGVIGRMGFAGYFLIVADFVQWTKSQGIPVGPGRGSGAGSVVAWALTITDLDPIRFGLLFERFLNPERVSMPDFDIDFCQERRDEVIAYVRREYGCDRVAQIITFGTLQARAAVRDVGRVLGLPYGQVNKVAELIPNSNPTHPVSLEQAIAGEPRLQEMRERDEEVRRLFEIALRVEGLYRHASTHAAGVVIGDRPLIELVPLYRDPRSDFLVTQYSMKHIEHAGLVKFDFLGLTTLTILKRATEFLAALGVTVDLARLPLDDPATYAMLQRGDAGGLFQFEGQGMRDVLRQMRPDRFEDLIAAVALYRPGPMANIPAFCQRKHGEAWEPPHPALAEVLGETYGIMVYQEQVMQIAQLLAGYSLGAADLLRRAMGKKIRAEMEAQRATFTEGCVARGISAEKAGEIFELMARFADYGFNKSHACAYALVAYQTAWLKANHPAVFLAACMSLALSNTDKLAAYRQEAGRLGIAVLPPDINRSGADFSVEREEGGALAIRYALAAVKKVGLAAMQEVVAARGGRPFSAVADFARRVDPRHLNRMQLENLVKAGAFDTLGANRARLHVACETILHRAQVVAAENGSGQIGLFGGAAAEALELAAIDDWAPMERLALEAEAIGFHLSAHPLDAYRDVLARMGAVASNRIEERAAAGAARLRLAGTVIAIKERMTRTGSRMAWVRLSDAGGTFEITLFSEVLARTRGLLEAGANLLVTADVRLEGESLRITAHEIAPLDEAAAAAGEGLRVWLDRLEAVGPIRSLLSHEAGGRGRVVLLPRLARAEAVEIALPGGFRVTPRLAQAMKLVPGVERVEVG